MTTLVGADGCRSGWLCIFEELPSRRIGSKVFSTVAELFVAAPDLDLLAIDIPIGLTDAGPRACDSAARAMLGPIRGTSVFAAPIRPALHAASYLEACDESFRAQQKKLSRQSWAIYPKIRELDDLLRSHPDIGERVYEVHPEVTFTAWNGTPFVEPKRKQPGFARRYDLVSGYFGRNAYEAIRARYQRQDVANDDILDAFAALWTAERILSGKACSLPVDPPLDAAGLPMRMMY
jgi:predicted RNase H-like nuclease